MLLFVPKLLKCFYSPKLFLVCERDTFPFSVSPTFHSEEKLNFVSTKIIHFKTTNIKGLRGEETIQIVSK